MGQPTYELPAPLQRVHKTTGIAAGEHPETPPSSTDHQMTQMGRNQTKTRLPLYKEGPLSKAIHATNWGNLAMQHSGFALLLAWALRHSKWNQIYGSLLQKVVKLKRTFRSHKLFKSHVNKQEFGYVKREQLVIWHVSQNNRLFLFLNHFGFFKNKKFREDNEKNAHSDNADPVLTICVLLSGDTSDKYRTIIFHHKKYLLLNDFEKITCNHMLMVRAKNPNDTL